MEQILKIEEIKVQSYTLETLGFEVALNYLIPTVQKAINKINYNKYMAKRLNQVN